MHDPKTLISPTPDITRITNFDFFFSSFATWSPDIAEQGPSLIVVGFGGSVPPLSLPFTTSSLLASFSVVAAELDFRFRIPLAGAIFFSSFATWSPGMAEREPPLLVVGFGGSIAPLSLPFTTPSSLASFLVVATELDFRFRMPLAEVMSNSLKSFCCW